MIGVFSRRPLVADIEDVVHAIIDANDLPHANELLVRNQL